MLHRYGKVLGEAGNGVSKNISHNVIKKRRSEAVKRIDQIRNMSMEAMAREAAKPVKIIRTEEISCRCPNDNYEVDWGVPEEELDLMYSFCPECGQKVNWS